MITPIAARPPYVSGAPPAWRRRPTGRPPARRLSTGHLALFGFAFCLAVAALLVPKAASFGTSSSADQAVASVGSAPAPQIVQPVDTLSPDDVAFVLSYAQDVRPDDALIQVRLGVFAKRSNVQGLPLHGRTVYYDVLPHQSYGPLRAGTLAVSDALILARHTTGNSTVLIYTRK